MASSESDDWEWNPTIQTPDGDPVTVEGTDAEPIYRDRKALAAAIDDGLTREQMADRFDTTVTTVQRWLSEHGLSDKTPRSEPKRDLAVSLHLEAGEDWNASDETRRVTPNGGDDRCPECGTPHDSEAAQHACLRSHAREVADRLERDAEIGREVLPVYGE